MIRAPGIDIVWDALPEARIVGGAVRDFLAGRAIADVDFASPLAPDAVIARLRAAGVKAVPTGIAHGTVTAVADNTPFEMTTLRRDVETDGRHAKVEFTDDWQADASRRDFTINAMSMARDGTVFDYFGGREDLAAGRVRFVGAAKVRIAEDYLRILRFFRFFARYAKGEPDAEAMAAITALRDGLKILSVERVWSEMKRILAADDPRAAVGLMDISGVLALVMPADVVWLAALIARGGPVEPMLRVAALLDGDAVAFAAGLKLSGAEAETLAALRAPNGLEPGASDADLRRALADTDQAVLIARTWLAQDERPGWDDLRARIAAARRPVFPVQGRDMTALGIPPGPEVGKTLARVRDWWMGGGCVADVAACRAEAKRLIVKS